MKPQHGAAVPHQALQPPTPIYRHKAGKSLSDAYFLQRGGKKQTKTRQYNLGDLKVVPNSNFSLYLKLLTAATTLFYTLNLPEFHFQLYEIRISVQEKSGWHVFSIISPTHSSKAVATLAE